MSKAFTSEEPAEDASELGFDESDADEADEQRPATSPYITHAGYKNLQAEFDKLWRTERPKVTTEVMWAAAQGDRSENAEYIYGKKRLREIDRRLRFLKRRLDTLQVVTPSSEQRGKVFFGATVTIEDEDGKKSTYTVVGPDEIDLKQQRISIDSPLAKSILGKSKGEYALVQRPRGETEVKILKIEYKDL